MPLSRWLGGGRPGLRDRVVKALQQARDGDADGAIDTIAERFSESLSELQSLRQPADPGWLRLAARLAYRAADMPAAADFARQALSREEDAATWNLLGRLGVSVEAARAEVEAAAERAGAPRRPGRPMLSVRAMRALAAAGGRAEARHARWVAPQDLNQYEFPAADEKSVAQLLDLTH